MIKRILLELPWESIPGYFSSPRVFSKISESKDPVEKVCYSIALGYLGPSKSEVEFDDYLNRLKGHIEHLDWKGYLDSMDRTIFYLQSQGVNYTSVRLVKSTISADLVKIISMNRADTLDLDSHSRLVALICYKILYTIKRSVDGTNIEMWFDGSCRGNGMKKIVSECGAGVLIRVEGLPDINLSKRLGNGLTNNQAEYSALIEGLKRLTLMGDDIKDSKLKIYGDSNLVINQMTDSWKCRSENLKSYLNEAKSCVRELKYLINTVEFIHVLRTDNTIADSLANQCLD